MENNNESTDFNVEIIRRLLSEFQEQRDSIKAMITDLDRIRQKIDKIFPETIDKRFVRIFEEKVKAVTGLFNSLLDMRKEITKSVKDEIELRRRLVKDEVGESASLEDLFDIRKIAKKVETFQKTSKNLEQEAA